jgi:hypothetical protein
MHSPNFLPLHIKTLFEYYTNGMSKTAKPNVFKLTMYMTPKQFDAMLNLSANDVASRDPNRSPPWLHMSTELDKYDEYRAINLEKNDIAFDETDEIVVLLS